MSDSGRANELKIDRVELAEALLEHAKGYYAKASNEAKQRHYDRSMCEALHSIRFSTELRGLFAGTDHHRELPGAEWPEDLMKALLPQCVGEEIAMRFRRIARELSDAIEIELDRIK